MEAKMGNRFKAITLILITILFVIATGCASTASKNASQVEKSTSAMMPAPRAVPSAPASDGEPYDTSTASGDSTIDRKIVRTGSISIQVNDINKSLADIAAIATQFNGYVVSSSQRADDEKSASGQISIRVPADKYDEALQKLRTLAVKVVYENSNSQDVTEQYMDLKAQLSNYQATEAQYLELLKKAENVKDVLEVQKELSNVRGNIERVKGRILYLERTSDTSLIQVSLSKVKPIGESTWDVGGIFKGAVDGLIAFCKVLLALLVWLLVFSPVWIIILVIIWLVRRKKAKAAVQK